MLRRFISNSFQIRFLMQLYPHSPHYSRPSISSVNPYSASFHFRHFSTDDDDKSRINDEMKPKAWRFSADDDEIDKSVFKEDVKNTDTDAYEDVAEKPWSVEKEKYEDVFKEVDNEFSRNIRFDDSIKQLGSNLGDEDWMVGEGEKPWSLGQEEKADDVFDIGTEVQESPDAEADIPSGIQKSKEIILLEKEEEELKAVLKGPDRAFGDLIAASGITNAMLDNLIALKDFEGVEGLPPLSEIEDIRYEKSRKKSPRADMERQKQEEVAKARVRIVDEKGRAYGTGRRKCSIARVWVQPGDGKFVVNDKQFDAYFPDLGHRATLLRPFSETKTLGRWNVKCTVKGGGTSGQVGAIRLGISKALQNWEPGFRPALKEAGLLTRDARVVERKKPGKAKARKSFQWVKR